MNRKKEVMIVVIVLMFIFGCIMLGFWAALSGALVIALLARLAYVLVNMRNGSTTQQEPLEIPEITKPENKRKVYLWIICMTLLVRVLTYIIGYVVGFKTGVVGKGFFDSFNRLWLNAGTDAPHYLGIAKNWYVTEGDPRFHIVFFPFFPILIRFAAVVFQDFFSSAMLVSTFCHCGFAIVGYELARLDYDKATALRFVKYMFILPGAFFYCAPMTESTFVLLCLLCIYCARKDKYVLATVLFGALAAFTRSQGVLLAVPCIMIAVLNAIKEYKKHQNKELLWCELVGRTVCLCFIATGTVAYLLINYSIWKDPFKFMQFQSEHWNQQLGVFTDTVNMIWQYFTRSISDIQVLSWQDASLRQALALWLPQLIVIIFSLIVVLFAVDDMHPAYTAFFIVYFVISIGATWLLSSPRYLMACFPVPLAIATITRTRKMDITMSVVCGLAATAYLVMYCSCAPIY